MQDNDANDWLVKVPWLTTDCITLCSIFEYSWLVDCFAKNSVLPQDAQLRIHFCYENQQHKTLSLKVPNVKFDVTVSVDKMQLLTHTSKIQNEYLSKRANEYSMLDFQL